MAPSKCILSEEMRIVMHKSMDQLALTLRSTAELRPMLQARGLLA